MKKTAPLAVALLSIAALAACTPAPSSSSSDESSESSAAPVTITWWNDYAVDEDGRGTDNDKNYLSYWFAQDVISAFQAEHPNITVETAYHGKYAAIATDVSAGISTGALPNIASTYGTYVHAWNESGVILDVTEKGRALEADNDFVASYLAAEKQQYGDKYLSLPYSKSTEVLMMNKEVFAATGTAAAGADAGNYVAPVGPSTKAAYAVPTTFVEMMATAAQMKADYPSIFTGKNADGWYDAIPVIYEDAANLFITALESAGVPFVTAGSDAAACVKFNTPEAKAVVKQLKKWNAEGLLCCKNQLAVSGQYHAYPSSIFGKGQAFAIIASTTGVNWMAADGYTVDYAKIPGWNSAASRKVLSQGPSLTFFKKANKAEEDASLLFYDFLTKAENSATLAVQTSYFPLRNSSANSEKVTALVAASNAGVSTASTSAEKKAAYSGDVLKINGEYASANEYFMSPVFELSAATRTAVGNLIDAVFNAEVTDDASIDALVDAEFTKAYSAILA